MSKAEEKAVEYQIKTYGPNVMGGASMLSEEEHMRFNMNLDFKNGYEQAEKDLTLTWEDIRLICEIDEDMRCHSDWPLQGQEVYYEEVLRRFREIKDK